MTEVEQGSSGSCEETQLKKEFIFSSYVASALGYNELENPDRISSVLGCNLQTSDPTKV